MMKKFILIILLSTFSLSVLADAHDIILQAVNNTSRPTADIDRDVNRKPAEVLEFFGIEPGMNVLDIFAGGGYLINRNSTVNLRIHAAISFPTYRIRDTYHPSLKFGIVTSFTK